MIKKLLVIFFFCFSTTFILAQPMITYTLNNSCFQTNANYAVLKANTMVTSTTWTVVGPSCTGNVLATSLDSALVQLNCCGNHLVLCTGYTGTTAIWTASAIINVPCTPTINVTNSSLPS